MIGTLILTAAGVGAHHAAEPSPYNPASPEFWVYVGITIFLLIAIFVAKAPKRIADALDARIADTRRQLDEARSIRAEAEALLARARAQHEASAGDAETTMQRARTEAEALLAEAERDAQALIARRQATAESKIAAAERSAIDAVRARAAEAATRGAARLIADQADADTDRRLVDGAIARL